MYLTGWIIPSAVKEQAYRLKFSNVPQIVADLSPFIFPVDLTAARCLCHTRAARSCHRSKRRIAGGIAPTFRNVDPNIGGGKSFDALRPIRNRPTFFTGN